MAVPLIYRAAVIGLGKIGWILSRDARRAKPATHVEAYLADPRVRLVAGADTEVSRRADFEAAHPELTAFGDVSDLLDVARPDIVSVATPPEQHAEVVIRCAEAGMKVILCEKPIADSVSAGNRMVRICRARGAILLVNHSRQFDPMIRATIRLLRDGHMGTVRALAGHYTAGLYNSGTHLMAMIQAIAGVPTRVVAVSSPASCPKDDLNADAVLAFDRDVVGTIQAHEVLDYAIFTLQVFTASTMVVFDDFGYSTWTCAAVPSPWFDGYRQLQAEAMTLRQPHPRSFIGSAVSYAVDVLAGDQPPISTGDDALAVLRALNAIARDVHGRVAPA